PPTPTPTSTTPSTPAAPPPPSTRAPWIRAASTDCSKAARSPPPCVRAPNHDGSTRPPSRRGCRDGESAVLPPIPHGRTPTGELPMTSPRIAIVHERFTEHGGSEAVVGEFARTWPHAEVFAPLVDTARAPAIAHPPWDTITGTWLDRLHAATGRRSHAPLMPLMPRALRGLPLRGYDAVVVSHHSFAIQAALATDAPVVAYVHSPARWAWAPAFRAHDAPVRALEPSPDRWGAHPASRAREADGPAGRAALAALGVLARRADLAAAGHLTAVVANSRAVADRVRDWWGLPAEVVNPP